ncbi:hypothetical protein ACFW04_005123 [Cataglyphis niger]
MANNEIFTENRNENFRIRSHMFFTATLEYLKNVLYVGLNPYFEEFEIAVVSCPCLTREPYNLAAAGLSGNTGILQIGFFENFRPRPRTNYAYNIYEILSRCNYDAFVIGSGFAAQPSMSYNGHLTMNAVVSTNDRNIINNSCIAYQHTTGQRRLEIINDHDQIKCSIHGNFFFSEGKRGPVIKIRAKGRRSKYNVTTLIEMVLKARYPLIGEKLSICLGIILVIKGGQTEQFILPDDYVDYDYNRHCDYYARANRYAQKCTVLTALGALINEKLKTLRGSHGRVQDSYCKFNTFFNCESPGEFFNDITEETEYTVYINIAQERCFVM